MRHGEGLRREPQTSAIPTTRFTMKIWDLESLNSCWRNLFSKLFDGNTEVHYLGLALRNIPRLLRFSMLESQLQDRSVCVCVSTPSSQLTMSWINDVLRARSIDDLMTSQSITGRRDFPDFEMLHAMIASALEKLLDKHIHFRSKCRRATWSQTRLFLEKHFRSKRERQIMHMFCKYFRAIGAYETTQGLSDLFTKKLTEWRRPRLRR